VLRNWIQTTVARYRGEVYGWVVVNEPLAYDTVALYDNVWRRVIGDDYIDLAFQWAQEADPDARLYLNETQIEASEPDWMGYRADFFHALVQGLVARAVPVHGVGFQMHSNLAGLHHPAPRDPALVAVQMQRYADLGLDVAFTEWDVAIDGAPGTVDERRQQQAQVYHDHAAACVAQPACRIIHLWGVSDAVAQYADFAGVPADEGQPVVFDVSYAPKPAYFALRRALWGR
jgi:endo-1,4-beta-xylanase